MTKKLALFAVLLGGRVADTLAQRWLNPHISEKIRGSVFLRTHWLTNP